ncbi:FlgO family outer membrane protein [Pseudoalteromonas shioyasakiensis]|uniref:FlgO family outer membrane protein n=1 Tax=Pseudoalteromonas shioyasakiensis TaxID=1190813 RepID=UPI0021189E30|nr:FlgO family outer membrane protein [Pseudoalteromonas shioyasakiensis]MCQ8877413.1 FlgO family outer membrane protein [Pseudoalteromonas shioyasakiensis]
MAILTKHAACVSFSLMVSLLTGCSTFDNSTQQPVTEKPQTTAGGYDLNQLIRQAQLSEQQEYQDATQFTPLNHHKTLVHYVEQMALDLVDTMQSEQDIAIAVTSFVDLDASLNNSSQLGNQLSESFIYQLQQFGYGVVDFKTTDQILVNERGDFVFSRDIENLANKRIASHVLSGTLIYRSSGVEVNTRVIDVQSKRVIASSQKLLPYYVLNNDDINLKRVSLN